MAKAYFVFLTIKQIGEKGPKWRHPSIVDRILKSMSFPYPT
jgi:hypothetical protein